jgi:serine/threonine protein kinase
MSAPYSTLFACVDSAISKVRHLLAGAGLAPELDRALHTFLQALMTVNRIPQELARSQMPAPRAPPDPVAPRDPPDADECRLICRICERPIPAAEFQAHGASCVKYYQSHSTMASVNERLSALQAGIGLTLLQTPWPGNVVEAIARVFPALHIVVLSSRVVSLDPHISDTLTELCVIQEVLTSFSAGDVLTAIASDFFTLVREKVRATRAIRKALYVLKRGGSCIQPLVRSIANFTFIRRISRGAFGSVFLASKKATGDIYAIKATPRHILNQKNQVQRISIEKDILLQFDSPYIVKFYYSMIGVNNVYLVTEFVPGGDLYSLLENIGALEEHTAKVYALQIVHALRCLREHGIIHRDIKPDNILVSATGMLKLTDFGLSYLGVVDRASEADHDISSASSFVGTPDYVAPEIITGRPHSFSVDYWSLGAMIYEFVVGTPPFHADDVHESHRRTLLAQLRFPDDCELSPELVDIVRRLLVVRPQDRLGHASIEEILAHPWFRGAGETEAPFVPELQSGEDTQYFKQRYAFDKDEDAAILADLEECGAETPPLSGMEHFASVGLTQLEKANERIVLDAGVVQRPLSQVPCELVVFPRTIRKSNPD